MRPPLRMLLFLPLFAACDAHAHEGWPARAAITDSAIDAEVGGVRIGGGFGSGIARDPASPRRFYIITDRGPNFDVPADGRKGFAAPRFQPRIGCFELAGETLRLERVIALCDSTGKPLTGLPPSKGAVRAPEIAVGADGEALAADDAGIDPEGIAAMADGTFWVSEEYGPDLLHVDAAGKTIERLSPGKKSSLGRAWPAVLARRKPNRGLEGLAATPDGKTLAAMIQSPLENPDKKTAKSSGHVRLILFDVSTGATRQYLVPLEPLDSVIGDVAAVDAHTFLMIERDSLTPGDPTEPSKVKRLVRIDVASATDVSDPADGPAGKLVNGATLESLSPKALADAGIRVAERRVVFDLLAVGYPHEKPEGLAILDPTTIVVVNDDDFGITASAVGKVAKKRLPARDGGAAVDEWSELWFVHLPQPLR